MISQKQSLREMRESDLGCVLEWRNHQIVRSMMFSNALINFETHKKWFENTSSDANHKLLIYEVDDEPAGFIQFKNAYAGGISEWGFYINPVSSKGTGSNMARLAMPYAFKDIAIHKICGHVLGFNERSIRYHQKLGFTREGILREQHYDGQKYQDVLCFGLLKNDWIKNQDI